MSRQKKDCVKVSYTLDRQIAELLERFCRDTGRTKTKVIEMAILDFVDKHNQEKE